MLEGGKLLAEMLLALDEDDEEGEGVTTFCEEETEVLALLLALLLLIWLVRPATLELTLELDVWTVAGLVGKPV